MYKKLIHFTILQLIIMFCATNLFASYNMTNEPFALFRGINVPRIYKGMFYLEAPSSGTNKYKIYTYSAKTDDGSFTDADPVMIITDIDSNQIASDDDSGTRLNSSVDLSIKAGDSKVVYVYLLSYDEDYAGVTNLAIRKNGNYHAGVYQIRFGSTALMTKWKKDDILFTTGYYQSYPIAGACYQAFNHQGIWNEYDNLCQTSTKDYSAAETCEEYAKKTGTKLKYNGVFPHSYKCELTNSNKDTVILAAQDWSKKPEVYWKWVRTGYWSWDRVKVEKERTIDMLEADETSGIGSNASLKMPYNSYDSYPAFIIGLYPWNEDFEPGHGFLARTSDEYNTNAHRYSATSSSNKYYGAFSDRIAVYRERMSTGDSDKDGLSDGLENSYYLISANDPDTDNDGIIDGLEVIGTKELPLPDLGATPWIKTVVAEVDRDTGMSLTNLRVESIEAASKALDEADIHFIGLTGVINADNLNVINRTPTQNIPLTCDGQCVLNNSTSNDTEFDLRDYPFVKRMMWVSQVTTDPTVCGQASGISALEKAASIRCTGNTFIHEFGHILGLGHGGPNDIAHANKPNYWSVMSYGVTLPVPGIGDFNLFTRSSHLLNDTRRVPMHFSKEKMLKLNEASLDESMGLLGKYNGQTRSYTFKQVSHDPLNLAANPFRNLTVTWLNWDKSKDGSGNDEMNTSTAEDIEGMCRLRLDDRYENRVTGAISDLESICYDSLESANDMDYFKNDLNMSKWSKCQYLDNQRNKLGLSANSGCTMNALTARIPAPYCK